MSDDKGSWSRNANVVSGVFESWSRHAISISVEGERGRKQHIVINIEEERSRVEQASGFFFVDGKVAQRAGRGVGRRAGFIVIVAGEEEVVVPDEEVLADGLREGGVLGREVGAVLDALHVAADRSLVGAAL